MTLKICIPFTITPVKHPLESLGQLFLALTGDGHFLRNGTAHRHQMTIRWKTQWQCHPCQTHERLSRWCTLQRTCLQLRSQLLSQSAKCEENISKMRQGAVGWGIAFSIINLGTLWMITNGSQWRTWLTWPARHRRWFTISSQSFFKWSIVQRDGFPLTPKWCQQRAGAQHRGISRGYRQSKEKILGQFPSRGYVLIFLWDISEGFLVRRQKDATGAVSGAFPSSSFCLLIFFFVQAEKIYHENWSLVVRSIHSLAPLFHQIPTG
jgi:hypothetical protein